MKQFFIIYDSNIVDLDNIIHLILKFDNDGDTIVTILPFFVIILWTILWEVMAKGGDVW